MKTDISQLILYILAVLGFFFAYHSHMPQAVVAKLSGKEVKFHILMGLKCPICLGFWFGLFAGYLLSMSIIIAGFASCGVIGLFEWSKTVIYSFAWALRVRATTTGQIVVNRSTLEKSYALDDAAREGAEEDFSEKGVDKQEVANVNLIRDFTGADQAFRRWAEKNTPKGANKQSGGNC